MATWKPVLNHVRSTLLEFKRLSAFLGRLWVTNYTVATRPTTNLHAGEIIFVSDAAAGSKFQGWDGAAWVSLG